ncbi:MAG TPA: cupin domain-containing protein [Roseiflexaceae bacterium]|nr:cupin domain-containing protein [Roseiflexaceae bacterium]HMP39197.1 cupin domain-containing protein [Roseiflexaceae bacterium]
MPGTTRIALYTLIGSVVISAGLGIVAILAGNWGWFEIRILLTTSTISAASIGALACAALWERRQTRPVPLSGMVLIGSSTMMIILGIWGDIDSEGYWKLALILAAFAVATAHIALLSLARLAPRFGWAMIVASIAIYGLAAIISATILFEDSTSFGFQLMGVASIVAASMSILIPIFHRLGRNSSTPSDQKPPLAPVSLMAEPIIAAPPQPISAIGQSFDLYEWQGSGPDYLHVHYADDEAWHVLEGSLTFRFADRQIDAPAGTTVFVPAGVPHSYVAATETTRYLIMLTPRLRELIAALHAAPIAEHGTMMRRFDSAIVAEGE